MKKGISLLILVITISVMLILVGTITFSGKSMYDNSMKTVFATEISMLQEAVNAFYQKTNGNLPAKNLVQLDVSLVTSGALEQFALETIINGKVDLYELDYKILDITSLKYGSKQEGDTDVYLVSPSTQRVYYAKGMKVGGNTYYTLTEELSNIIHYKPLDQNALNTDGILFIPSETSWTKQEITVIVKVPSKYTGISVTSSIGTVTNSLQDTFQVYTVKGISSNGKVTVQYTKDGAAKTAEYVVNNIDKVAPTVEVDSNQQLLESENKKEAFFKISKQLDETSGIKWVKYTNKKIAVGEITSYFETKGILVKDGIVPIVKDVAEITVVASDFAGNMSYVYVTVKEDIYQALISQNTINSALTISDALGYVTDQLLLHCDGIYNTGLKGTTDYHDNGITTWKDLTFNNKNLVLENCKWNYNSVALDGTTSAIKIGNNLIDLFKADNTIEILVKFNDNSNRDILFGNHPKPNSISYEKHSMNRRRVFLNGGAIDYYSDPSNPIVINNIQLITYVYDKTNSKILVYEDGVLVDTIVNEQIASYNFDYLDAWLGKDNRGNSDVHLYGNIYAIRVYNRALTLGEITKNYSVDKERYNYNSSYQK